MENLIASVFSGFSQVVSKLLGHPLDFLAGKSCSSNCGPTWDFICYIENFCISHLLKLAMVIVLFYFVLLFLYLTYKLGICQCICHTICRSTWACFATCFSMLECCCNFLCFKLQMHNQRRRRKRMQDIEELRTSSEEEDYGGSNYPLQSKKNTHENEHRRRLHSTREYKREHLRRALRPKTHRVRVGISNDSFIMNKRNSIKHPVDHIRVSRTSKFAQKRGSFKGSLHHRRR